MNQNVLIYLNCSASQGINELQRKIFQARKMGRIVNSSSVYKRRDMHLNSQKLEIVIEEEIITPGTFEEVQNEVEALGGLILVIQGELRVAPKLPTPHPMLLSDPFLLKMAAECAPFWEHRVKQQTLQALSSQNLPSDSVEFLTQGKALINV